jgi:hypothetical protein
MNSSVLRTVGLQVNMLIKPDIIKSGKYLDQLSNCEFYKKNF